LASSQLDLTEGFNAKLVKKFILILNNWALHVTGTFAAEVATRRRQH
jgi:hypothetical protein